MSIDSITISNPGISAQASTILKSDESKLNSFESAMENAMKDKDEVALKKSCQEFESYFLQTMFREMRKTTNLGSTVLPKSQAEEMFQDMLDEETSKSIASTRGIGLADMMYKQMIKNI